MIKNRFYNIGGMEVLVNFHASLFFAESPHGSKGFQKEQASFQWQIDFKEVPCIDASKFQILFEGNSHFQEEIPYKWFVIKEKLQKGLFVELENHEGIKRTLSYVNITEKSIVVYVEKCIVDDLYLDPFFHPLGILHLIEMARVENAFLLHASGINDKGAGYVFSAVSGTGKSTMAKLWHDQGANIVNDDRLLIRVSEDGKVQFYNTPMPYYKSVPSGVELSKFFLIKQSIDNYIKPLSVLEGALKILGNCMQHQYDKKQVSGLLDLLERAVSICPAYELGFKPDSDVVDLIRSHFGK